MNKFLLFIGILWTLVQLSSRCAFQLEIVEKTEINFNLISLELIYISDISKGGTTSDTAPIVNLITGVTAEKRFH